MNNILGEIFIVDDDPLILMNYSDFVEDAGYLPVTANSISSAWSILQERRFDLMLCDHDLTDGKGIELLSKMSEADIFLPVIYITAASPSLLDEVKKNLLVKKILSKPVDNKVLLEMLKLFIKKEKTLFSRLVKQSERDELLRGIL